MSSQAAEARYISNSFEKASVLRVRRPLKSRYKGQGFDDLVFGRAPPIENRPFGFGESSATGITFETLSTGLGLAELDDVMLVFALQLAIVVTDRVWTKISYLGTL